MALTFVVVDRNHFILIAMQFKVCYSLSGNCNICESVNKPSREWCLGSAYCVYCFTSCHQDDDLESSNASETGGLNL